MHQRAISMVLAIAMVMGCTTGTAAADSIQGGSKMTSTANYITDSSVAPTVIGNASVEKIAYPVNTEKRSNRDFWVHFGVSGKDTVVAATPLDVVLLLDRSSSMKNDMNTLHASANQFVKSVLDNNKNNRVAVVSFADSKDGSSGNPKTNAFSSNYNNIQSFINGITANGNTNQANAFDAAKTLLASARTNAKKVVIMFTDGAPAPSGSDLSYEYSVSAKSAADGLRSAYSDAEMYCIYWNPGLSTNRKFKIPDNAVNGSTMKEKTFGVPVEEAMLFFVFHDYYYLTNQNDFVISYVMPTFVTSPDKLVQAEKGQEALSKVFDGIAGEILSFAKNVVISDTVGEHFHLDVANAVQYRLKTKAPQADNAGWTTVTSNASQAVYYSFGENETQDIQLHFKSISEPGVEVRFKITANEGVYSSDTATAGNPDLLTNESAELTYKDATGTTQSGTIEQYPLVYIPKIPLADILSYTKTAQLSDWESRIYTIKLTATAHEAETSAPPSAFSSARDRTVDSGKSQLLENEKSELLPGDPASAPESQEAAQTVAKNDSEVESMMERGQQSEAPKAASEDNIDSLKPSAGEKTAESLPEISGQKEQPEAPNTVAAKAGSPSVTASSENVIKNAQIIDVIDARFELTQAAKDYLAQHNATVSNNRDGTQTITWSNQQINTASDGHEYGWSAEFTIRAKSQFIGGNNIPTNAPGSGIRVGSDTVSFLSPIVNVKTEFSIESTSRTIFFGEAVPEYTPRRYKVPDMDMFCNLGATGSFSFAWMDRAGDDMNLPYDTFPGNTYYPEAESQYVLSAVFSPEVPLDSAKSNSGGYVAEDYTATGTYTINVVKGELDLTKIIDQKYPAPDSVNAKQSFVFKITRSDTKGGTAADTFYEVITPETISSSGTMKKITGLKKGYYTVTEDTDAWRYTKTGTADNDSYDGGTTADGIVFIGRKTSGQEEPTAYFGEGEGYGVASNPAAVTITNNLTNKHWLGDTTVAVNTISK